MAGTRQITYASVSDTAGGQVVFSDAETWGSLKASENDILMKSNKMKAWVKAENGVGPGYSLQSDEAKLPDGNFTLTFIVDKNDSGDKVAS